MKETLPEFVQGASNVYRTHDYIVKQCIGLKYDREENNAVVSHDTFYRRTPQRDAEYEMLFKTRKHPDGKRLPSTMYERTYVD